MPIVIYTIALQHLVKEKKQVQVIYMELDSVISLLWA